MKKGKIIFIDKKISSDEELEKIKLTFKEKNCEVEFASENNQGFYTIPEATLVLLKKGAKLVSATSLSLPHIEVPLYWGTY